MYVLIFGPLYTVQLYEYNQKYIPNTHMTSIHCFII